LRPSIGTQSTQPKAPAKPIRARPISKKVEPPRPSIIVSESEDDDLESFGGDVEEATHADEDGASSEDLAENPLAMKPAAQGRRSAPRDVSPMAVSDDEPSGPSHVNAPTDDVQALLRNAAGTTDFEIPQPLLVRLLHEAFEDKSTQIDRRAIKVLQTYFDVFIRETIERAKLAKREAVALGGDDVDEDDADWLDVEDLAKVAPAMLCEF
jgi:histone H3/H4